MCECDDRSIQGQLKRILNSRTFRHARVLKEFLRIVVEETCKSRAAGLCGDVIATRLYGEPDDTVRVHAHNLRDKLDAYYKVEGAQDPLRISMPKGSYLAAFHTISSPLGRPNTKHVWREDVQTHITAAFKPRRCFLR
jgi:hypothetical protein